MARLPGTPTDDQSCCGDVDRDELVATLVDAAPVGAWVTTADGTFEHVNPACTRLWGYDPTELVGQHFTVVVPPESRIRLRAVHDRLIAGGGQVREAWELLTQDRSRHRVAANACRVLGGDGQYRKVTLVIDVSEQDRLAGALAQADAELAEANFRLAHLAAHDSLTGLPDHRRSHELLVQAMEIAERYGRDLAVAVVDLDRFKAINDTFGHMEGDQVLIEFARQVQTQLRAVDAVGRLGGEEFLVVLPETTAAGAVVVLDRVRTACWDHLHAPDGRPVEFSAGVIGFVAHEIPQMLLRRADAALARAKDAGRNRTELG